MIVSIIIPVFNTKYEDLLKCLDSILAQTFPNFEVVIIDDGSEDYYGNRLDELVQLDSRISVFHKKNEGVSVARNFGVNKAIGQYILFVDGDDILTPWLLESAIQAVEDYDCDVIVGMINTTDKRPSIFPSREKNVKFELLDVKIELKWKSTRIEDSMQPPLKAPFPKPDGREQFWNDVNDKSFSYIARAYGDSGTANYIKKVLRRAKRKIQHLISKT